MSRKSNGDARRSIKVKYWACVALHPDEILQGPDEIIEKLKQKEEELITENQRLRNEIKYTKRTANKGFKYSHENQSDGKENLSTDAKNVTGNQNDHLG